ncbi:MAG: hypothetical protein ACSLEM_04580 [Candidatus Malihini olakiniferum]
MAKYKKDTDFSQESFKQLLDTGKYDAIEVTLGIHHAIGSFNQWKVIKPAYNW